MMDGMERRRECAKGMTEPAVDYVFQESPQKHARGEQGGILDHKGILSDHLRKAVVDTEHCS